MALFLSVTDKIDHMYLNRWVKDRICEQGINYLEELAQVLLPGGEGKTQISIIMKNHPGDVKSCFTMFFNEWGEREVESTWQKLIDALISTSKRALASEIKNMLSPLHLQWKDEPMEEENKGMVWRSLAITTMIAERILSCMLAIPTI